MNKITGEKYRLMADESQECFADGVCCQNIAFIFEFSQGSSFEPRNLYRQEQFLNGGGSYSFFGAFSSKYVGQISIPVEQILLWRVHLDEKTYFKGVHIHHF